MRVRNPASGQWIAQHHANALKGALAEVGRPDAAVVCASGDFRVRVPFDPQE